MAAAAGVQDEQNEWLDDYLVKDRLLMYFTKATAATTLPVLVAFLSLTLGKKEQQEHVKIAFCAVSLFSLLAITVPLAYSSGLQDDPIVTTANDVDDASRKKSIRRLCASAYLSNISLILTVVILTVLLSPAYVAPTSPVLLLSFPLVLYCGFTVYTVEREPWLRWRNVLDHRHATDFTFVFNVSSEVTQTALLGLSAVLFGNNLKNHGGGERRRQGDEEAPIRAAEALLVYAAVFGLAMMLACSVPPVITNTRHREKVVNRFIRAAACVLVALVATAAFAAVATLMQGYIVVALALVIAVSVVWFLKLYRSQPAEPTPVAAAGGAQQQHPSQFLRNHWNVVLWPGLYPAMFGALMAAYSQPSICRPMGKLYKTTVFFVFLAIVSNLARMIILREGGRRSKMRAVSVGVTAASMALALIFVVLLVLLQRGQVRNTFIISSGSYGG